MRHIAILVLLSHLRVVWDLQLPPKAASI